MKVEKHVRMLTEKDLLDITFIFKKNKITKFALNYRAEIGNA